MDMSLGQIFPRTNSQYIGSKHKYHSDSKPHHDHELEENKAIQEVIATKGIQKAHLS
jgi:hypothetical protein